MRMRRLIWVCPDLKGLIVPKVFSKFPHSDPLKLGPFHCFLKISTNAALFPEYIWVLPRSKDNPGSQSLFEHLAWAWTKLHMKTYRILRLSLVRLHKWVRHGHFYLMCCRKQNKHTKITKRIKHLPPVDELCIYIWYSCNWSPKIRSIPLFSENINQCCLVQTSAPSRRITYLCLVFL